MTKREIELIDLLVIARASILFAGILPDEFAKNEQINKWDKKLREVKQALLEEGGESK